MPILAKSDGLIVDGHLCLKAARQLGLATVTAAIADFVLEAQHTLANKPTRNILIRIAHRLQRAGSSFKVLCVCTATSVSLKCCGSERPWMKSSAWSA